VRSEDGNRATSLPFVKKESRDKALRQDSNSNLEKGWIGIVIEKNKGGGGMGFWGYEKSKVSGGC
jgi:hypothetical protein